MPAYCLFDKLEVMDAASFDEYRARVGAVIEAFGGRYRVIGGPVDLVEGTWQPSYPVMIEFPTLEQAHAWYDSDEYRELKELRLSAARFNAVFMDGV